MLIYYTRHYSMSERGITVSLLYRNKWSLPQLWRPRSDGNEYLFPVIFICGSNMVTKVTMNKLSHSGIFSITFLQPVNGSKNSIFSCFFSFLFLKHPLKIFHSIHLFFLLFGLDTYKHIKDGCMYLFSQIFFKTPNRTRKFQEKSKKNAFSNDLQT